MQINDNFKHPFKGMKEIKRAPTSYLEIQPAYMEYARKLILDESLAQSSIDHHPMMLMREAEDLLDSECAFFPGSKAYDLISNHSFAERIESLKFKFTHAKQAMEKELNKCQKLEDSYLKVAFGGYFKKHKETLVKHNELIKNLQQKDIQLEVFKVLASQESKSLNSRREDVRKMVQMQEEKENEL